MPTLVLLGLFAHLWPLWTVMGLGTCVSDLIVCYFQPGLETSPIESLEHTLEILQENSQRSTWHNSGNSSWKSPS